MGGTKMKKKLILIIVFISYNINADEFSDFKKTEQSEYSQYQENTKKEFLSYKEAYQKSYEEFAKELSQIWPNRNDKIDISAKKRFVQYSKDLNSKQTIDYEEKNISIEVIAKNNQEAKQKIETLFNKILEEDVKTAYEKDILEQKILKKINPSTKPAITNQKLISDVITGQEKVIMKNKIKEQNLIIVKHNGNFIYKANVKMPANSIIRKAKIFKQDILKNSDTQEILPELIYAIIHSESSFNPMARSHIPAFGLMQIVPKSAGIDSYQYLYKKKRILSSSYLYDSSKNITIGSAYLHILYYKYLKKIQDPQSRLYCTIAAYNTGAGNVAKTFIGITNINKAANKINSMSPQKVYSTLLQKLPYLETRKYLKKVNDRISAYNKLLKDTI